MKYDKIVTFGCSYSECLNNSDSSIMLGKLNNA
jgi:hypothetical protein